MSKSDEMQKEAVLTLVFRLLRIKEDNIPDLIESFEGVLNMQGFEIVKRK